MVKRQITSSHAGIKKSSEENIACNRGQKMEKAEASPSITMPATPGWTRYADSRLRQFSLR
jgi:hypothetical protein